MDIGQEVVGIFSIPREFRISWSATSVSNVQYKGFEGLAERQSIPLIYVEKKMSDPEYKEWLQRLRPDILIVVGWYYMLPRSLRDLAPLGAVGLHASLLPKYRGGAPLVWAVINGETRAGVSLFHFGDGVDEGDLIGQADFDIAVEDDIADVLNKASQASVSLVHEFVPLLGTGKASRIRQDHSHATTVPQRRPEDGRIDWSAGTAKQIYDWVRAQTRPYPGAFTALGQEKITIWKASIASVSTRHAVLPGSIRVGGAAAPDAFGVSCADASVLWVREVGLEDGTTMTGADFVAARAIVNGIAFDETG
jgi:methionyl-tRNA formyltransferase